jgi:Transcriptional regulator, AbiEi antitoxin
MGDQTRTVARKIARIASSAHGVVSRQELLRAGLTARQVERRIEDGSLIPEFRGVYRVGHRAPSREARYLAAVKACGVGAVLSGRAAAHLWGLIPGQAPPPEVTCASERRVQGITTRRRRAGPIEATECLGIAVTTVPRTLIDLAAVLTPDALARACHEAGVRYGTTPAQVDAILRPNAPGAGRLRAVLEGDTKVTLSKLERRFLEVLTEHGLPLPETNRPAGTRRVDCRWPEHRLTVELDSYKYHRSRHAWEQDHHREREAHARGDEFRRYTYGDAFDAPRLMLVELRALLA